MQWHLPKIQAPSAWDLTTGSSTTPIAIIDSGIDSTHPDLASRILSGWSFLTGTSNTTDVLGHGTAVAGTAAAISITALECPDWIIISIVGTTPSSHPAECGRLCGE
jgi:subtilisin family serine protease